MADTIFKIPKLKGSSNYDIWSIRVQSILVEKGYLEVVSENYIDKALDDTAQIDALKVLAYKATALIKLSLEDGPLLQTRFIDNPFILWTTLRNLYETKGFSSEFIISKDLINTTLNSCKGNLEAYINSFKRSVNSLQSKNIVLPNKFLIALLLNNLNKDYDYVVAIITQTIRVDNTTNYTLDDIISQLLDESRRLYSLKGRGYNYNKNYNNSYNNSYNNYDSDNSSNNSYTKDNRYENDIEMSMQSNRVNYNSKKNVKICSYCNIKGHLESNCFKKYPSLRNKPTNNKAINYSKLEDSYIVENVLNTSTKSIKPSYNTRANLNNSKKRVKVKASNKEDFINKKLSINTKAVLNSNKRVYIDTSKKEDLKKVKPSNNTRASINNSNTKRVNYKPSIKGDNYNKEEKAVDFLLKLPLRTRSINNLDSNISKRLENYKAIKSNNRLESYKVIKSNNNKELNNTSRNTYNLEDKSSSTISSNKSYNTTLESKIHSILYNIESIDCGGILDSKSKANFKALTSILPRYSYKTIIVKIAITILSFLEVFLAKYYLENYIYSLLETIYKVSIFISFITTLFLVELVKNKLY